MQGKDKVGLSQSLVKYYIFKLKLDRHYSLDLATLTYAVNDALIGNPEILPKRISIPKADKDAVLARDNNKCQSCGEQATEIDHVIPVSKGGNNEMDNLQALCRKCNMQKGSH